MRTSWRPCAGKVGGGNSREWIGSRVARKRRLRGLSSLPAGRPERHLDLEKPAQEPCREPSNHPTQEVGDGRRPYWFSAERELSWLRSIRPKQVAPLETARDVSYTTPLCLPIVSTG